MKVILKSIVASVAVLGLAACSKGDLYDANQVAANKMAEQKQKFETNFETKYGKVDPNQSWDFSTNQQRTNTGEMNANVSIDFYTAMLGGEVMITLSNGSKVKMKIKPETQPGTKVRLRGKGYDRGDGTFGDLIITYQVKLPTNLTDRQRDLLQQMRQG